MKVFERIQGVIIGLKFQMATATPRKSAGSLRQASARGISFLGAVAGLATYLIYQSIKDRDFRLCLNMLFSTFHELHNQGRSAPWSLVVHRFVCRLLLSMQIC